MADPWTPEHVVDAPLALKLIREQFPMLQAGRATPLGAGFDNTAFLVDEQLVFRFPRRQIAVALLETEARHLPRLQHLPLGVPQPEWHGRPSSRFPWPFLGYRLLPGQPAEALDPARAPGILGAFLAGLHAVPPEGLPGDAFRKTAFRERLPELREGLRALGEDERILAQLDEPLPGPPAQLATVHGDLYERHVLVDASGAPCGVIDWGDLHAGDPAVDLAIAFRNLPRSARAAFFDAYGPVDARTLRAARLRAAFHAVATARYARSTGDEPLLRAALAGLRFALEP